MIAKLADLGVSGEVKIPDSPKACSELLAKIKTRIADATQRFEELASSRTGDQNMQAQLMELLGRWFVGGRETVIST